MKNKIIITILMFWGVVQLCYSQTDERFLNAASNAHLRKEKFNKQFDFNPNDIGSFKEETKEIIDATWEIAKKQVEREYKQKITIELQNLTSSQRNFVLEMTDNISDNFSKAENFIKKAKKLNELENKVVRKKKQAKEEWDNASWFRVDKWANKQLEEMKSSNNSTYGLTSEEVKEHKRLLTEIKEFKANFAFEKQNALRDVEIAIKMWQKELPINIGGVIVTEMNYSKDRNLVTNIYKSPQVRLKNLTKNDIDSYKREWIRNCISTMKNNPHNKSFVRAKIDFAYILYDKENQEILRFKIKYSQYR